MYEKMVKQMTPGVRMMMGGVFFLVGIIWQICSHKTLDMYAFYIMAAAVLCFTNVILSKMTKAQTDPVLYILLNMVILIIGFALTGSDRISGAVMYMVWLICLIADAGINAMLLKCEGIAKRAVMGFVAVVFHVVFIGVVFMIPVLIAAFYPNPVPV